MKLRRAIFENGLLMHTCGYFGNVLRFMGPLIISEDLLEIGIQVYEQAVRLFEHERLEEGLWIDS